jgi:hypothetical protein
MSLLSEAEYRKRAEQKIQSEKENAEADQSAALELRMVNAALANTDSTSAGYVYNPDVVDELIVKKKALQNQMMTQQMVHAEQAMREAHGRRAYPMKSPYRGYF